MKLKSFKWCEMDQAAWNRNILGGGMMVIQCKINGQDKGVIWASHEESKGKGVNS